MYHAGRIAACGQLKRCETTEEDSRQCQLTLLLKRRRSCGTLSDGVETSKKAMSVDFLPSRHLVQSS